MATTSGPRAVGGGPVHVGLGVHQDARHLQIAFPGREEQRRHRAGGARHRARPVNPGTVRPDIARGRLRRARGPVGHAHVGLRVDIGALREQQADDGRMVFQDGPHQRRLSAHAFFRVHGGAAVEQQRDGVHLARSGGGHQRRFSAGIGGVRIRSAAQQRVDRGGIAVDAGEIQRRHAVAGRRIDLGAGANQHLRGFHVVSTHGPMKRRRAVGLGGVDVDLLLEQRANGLAIRPHDRVGQSKVAAGGAQTDGLGSGRTLTTRSSST